MKTLNNLTSNMNEEEKKPKKNHIRMWKKIKNVKKLLKHSRHSRKNKGSFGDLSSRLSEEGSQTPSGWWMKGLAPELQQRQKNLDGDDAVNVSEIICSIPETHMDIAISVLDTTESNMLHLACYNGSSLKSLNYILENCAEQNTLLCVNREDIEGNLPLHIASECVCRDKISLEEGMKVVERLYNVCPDTIHHMNHNKETALDVVFQYLTHIHTESIEYQKMNKFYNMLRRFCLNAYLAKKQRWEKESYQPINFKIHLNGDSMDTGSCLTDDVLTKVSTTNAAVL